MFNRELYLLRKYRLIVFFFSGYEYFLGFLMISSLVLIIVLIVFKLLRLKICGLE